jgi:hypothetical protein
LGEKSKLFFLLSSSRRGFLIVCVIAEDAVTITITSSSSTFVGCRISVSHEQGDQMRWWKNLPKMLLPT